MKKPKYNKIGRGAFTLVETLIVIIIIGVLAGLMLAASGSVTRKAEDTRAINDMTVIKKATMLVLAESSISDKTQLFIQVNKGTVTVRRYGTPVMSDAQKKALAKSMAAAFDTSLSAKTFSVAYDVNSHLTLMYYPNASSNYPYYYIYEGTAAIKDSSIYCKDNAESAPRIVKSY